MCGRIKMCVLLAVSGEIHVQLEKEAMAGVHVNIHDDVTSILKVG